MGLQIGIVGLPNVGKSTLFNALTRSKGAEMANYPFCTIEPNVGLVTVPDPRLKQLEAIVKPQKTLPTVIEFVDIAGLVKGASSGEGLGNKFLSNIRQCDAILQVVRVFENGDIQHVSEVVDPKSDIEVINTELILADLDTVEKRVNELKKKSRSPDKDAKIALEVTERVLEGLSEEKLVIDILLTDEERLLLKDLHLLTNKPIMYAANLAEDQVAGANVKDLQEKMGLDMTSIVVPVSARVEEELNELDEEESQMFLEDLGLQESTLNPLIRGSYDLLGLQTYFTAGEKEVRAWTIKKGYTAPQAAGVIHTDFEKGFIRAEVCAFSDYVEFAGESGCRDKGKLRSEGKEYVMKDGDVTNFLHSA
ncbi:MAG: redox-regulated ATPase YchF [Candidatus Gracilibacteria bacterium]|nr:redox-regulated ATPase YchF [Candidatus Gracilibacteria bacterium]